MASNACLWIYRDGAPKCLRRVTLSGLIGAVHRHRFCLQLEGVHDVFGPGGTAVSDVENVSIPELTCPGGGGRWIGAQFVDE